MTYDLAIEFKGCSSKDTCLLNKKGKCTVYLDRCKQKLLLNPLCFAKNTRECSQRNVVVKTVDKKKYIVYNCSRCNCRFKGDIKKYLSKLNRNDIYYGDKFNKLAKKLFKDEDKPKKISTDDEVVEYFRRILSSIGSD